MGWDNSHQYLVGNQECNALDDRIIFNPLTWAPIIRNTVLHNAIKSERRDFKEARAPSEFWSYWSAKLKSIFFSFFSRFNNDPVKKMEEAIPAPNTDFIRRLST